MSESPDISRREFQQGAGSLMLGGALIVPTTGALLGVNENEKEQELSISPACDFRSSFMTWDSPHRKDPRPHARHNIPHGNMARIELDALIDVIDHRSGKSERFVLIAPCRTEWVYAEDRLFQIPSSEYRNVYSLSQQRSMSRSITHSGNPTRGRPIRGSFRTLKIDVRTSRRTRHLTSAAKIVEATAKNIPLVGRTLIDDPKGNTRYVLEYPIKTMNFQPKTNSFQVDTGPLLAPDFGSAAEQAIDRLELAHVAYNRLDRAEFIFRRPTPIKDQQEKTLCQVLHYSEARQDKAKNVILAVETS